MTFKSTTFEIIEELQALLEGDRLPHNFEAFVKNILPNNKAKEVLNYVTYPLPTTHLIKDCLAKYNSLFLQMRADNIVTSLLPKLFDLYIFQTQDYIFKSSLPELKVLPLKAIINIGDEMVEYKTPNGTTTISKSELIPISELTISGTNFKKNLFYDVVGDLKWFLFYSLSKRYLDTYGAYPIYSGYESKCDYTNQITGEYCKNGLLWTAQGNPCFTVDNERLKCPCCKEKKLVGAGSFVSVPIPTEGVPNLSDPVKMLSVDYMSLKYSVDEVKRLKNSIYFSMTGDSSLLNEVAVNDIQTDAILSKQFQIYASFKSDTLRLVNEISEELGCGLAEYPDDIIKNIKTEQLISLIGNVTDPVEKQAVLDVLLKEICEEKGVSYKEVKLIQSYRPLNVSYAELKQLYDDGIITTEEYRETLMFDRGVAYLKAHDLDITKENIEKWLRK